MLDKTLQLEDHIFIDFLQNFPSKTGPNPLKHDSKRYLMFDAVCNGFGSDVGAILATETSLEAT